MPSSARDKLPGERRRRSFFRFGANGAGSEGFWKAEEMYGAFEIANDTFFFALFDGFLLLFLSMVVLGGGLVCLQVSSFG